MSTVVVSDKRGGIFQVAVTFTYEECERLPYNHLRNVGARIEQIPDGGIKATAEFSVRKNEEASKFVKVLDMFGEGGSFKHGSSSSESGKSDDLSQLSAAVKNTSSGVMGKPSKAPSPEKSRPVNAEPPIPESMEVEEDADEEMEVEEDEPALEEVELEADVEVEVEAPAWVVAGNKAVARSIALNESKNKCLQRVSEAAGGQYTQYLVLGKMAELLLEKYKDNAFVASVMNRNGWKEVKAADIEKIVSAGKAGAK